MHVFAAMAPKVTAIGEEKNKAREQVRGAKPQLRLGINSEVSSVCISRRFSHNYCKIFFETHNFHSFFKVCSGYMEKVSHSAECSANSTRVTCI